MPELTTVAQKVARLAELDQERAQLLEELRSDMAVLKAALPRRRTQKAAKAVPVKRGRKPKAAEYSEPDSRD